MYKPSRNHWLDRDNKLYVLLVILVLPQSYTVADLNGSYGTFASLKCLHASHYYNSGLVELDWYKGKNDIAIF